VKLEEILEKLEQITSKLEKDEMPLDEAIASFEEGLTLSASAKELLDTAKLRVEQVVERAKGTFSLDPFDGS